MFKLANDKPDSTLQTQKRLKERASKVWWPRPGVADHGSGVSGICQAPQESKRTISLVLWGTYSYYQRFSLLGPSAGGTPLEVPAPDIIRPGAVDVTLL